MSNVACPACGRPDGHADWCVAAPAEQRAMRAPADMADDEFLSLVAAEATRARSKFPRPEYTLAALTEELGELARACLHEVQASEPNPYAAADVLKEAVQVATVAMRIATEGDESLCLPPRKTCPTTS